MARLNRTRQRGLTLIELLVALTITLVVVGGVATAFVQVIRASNEANASTRAHTASRLAADKIAGELRALYIDADQDQQQFLLIDRPLTYGDGFDDDGDGSVDEELADAVDNDGDWQIADDVHAVLGTVAERRTWVGQADYGDRRVDEDVRFSNDEVTFILPPTSTQPRRRVTYRIGSFDGEDNVLLREVVTNPPVTGPFTPDVVEPVVFGVLSLDIMAWNPNNNIPIQKPYWVSTWDATANVYPAVRPLGAPDGVPPFKLPAAMLVRVTTTAETAPLEDLPPLGTAPIRSVTSIGMVSIEATISDIRYFLYTRAL